MKSLIFAAALVPYSAFGTTIIVTTTADEDDGSLGGGTGVSLREAVKYSAPGDAINFAPVLSGQTIRLTLGEITIANSLLIDGSALAEKITLSGDKTGNGKTDDDTRILTITADTVFLNSLILTGGYCPAGNVVTQGAGIYVNKTTTRLFVRNSTFSGNSATNGGAIYFYGQPYGPYPALKIENSIFIPNSVSGRAGAIYVLGAIQIFDSTFAENTAQAGGAIYSENGASEVSNSRFLGNSATGDGGAIWNYRELRVTGSTFSGNSAPYGGGVSSSFGAPLILENSTLTGNFARDSGGGLFISGATTTILHSTLTGNTALVGGGGIWRKTSNSIPVGNISINNSIISGNTAPATPDVATTGTFIGSNNFTSGNPRLAPLGDYGGPTETMPPMPGSPVINLAATTNTLATDQRSFPRVGVSDIGAAEYQGGADLARFWKVDADGDGSPYGVEQALGTDPLVADPTNTRRFATPRFNVAGHAVLSFGIAPAVLGTGWILRRSPDLSGGSFTEIYRTDGVTDTAVPGVTFERSATRVTVTDGNSLAGRAFYRFEAVLEL